MTKLSTKLDLLIQWCWIFLPASSITMTSHDHHGVSNHRQLDWLFTSNSLSIQTPNNTPTLHITDPLSSMVSPHKWPAMRKTFPYHDVFMISPPNLLYACLTMITLGGCMTSSTLRRLWFPYEIFQKRMPLRRDILCRKIEMVKKCISYSHRKARITCMLNKRKYLYTAHLFLNHRHIWYI